MNLDKHFYKSSLGLTKELILKISETKNEPGWMTDFRLKSWEIFQKLPLPKWGPTLSALDLEAIVYYLKPLEEKQISWESVPEKIKNTFIKLGIPQAEQKFLAGVGAQYESELIYKNLKKEWIEKGVIFSDLSEGIINYSDLIKSYFSKIIPPQDNKFAALNSAVWSGGSFVYVPTGVSIEQPLQAYFRIQAAQMGQFERTLIIAEPNSFVHYVEGCSAPLYRAASLHSAVVELVALPSAHIRYTTIQNWSKNVFNLVTKRALAHEHAKIDWIDGNFGSKVTMKYPSIILKGKYAQGQIISIAVAGKGQHQDSGGKVIHLAPHTKSCIISKSMSQKGGRASYRGLVKIAKGAYKAHVQVQCDALLFDNQSQSDTYPSMQIQENSAFVGHEASVSKITNEQLFYLQSRGLSQDYARTMIATGFVDIFLKELPMEYAVEINRLLAMEMEGSVG